MDAVQIRKKRSAWRRLETITGWAFAMPAILGFCAFTLLPMIVSLFLSMTDYSPIRHEVNFIGIQNYTRMFTDSELFVVDALKATGYYTLLNVPASLAVALLLSLGLNANIRGRGIFRTLFYLPSIVPMIATCTVWLWLLNQQYGLFTVFFKQLGLGTPGWLWEEATVIPTIVLMGLWNTGGTMVIFLAGLQGIPRVYYEALSVDGGNAWHKFWHVTIPGISSTLWFVFITRVIGSFQVFDLVYVITGGGPAHSTETVVSYIYDKAFTHSYKLGYSSAAAECLFVVILLCTIFLYGRMLVGEKKGGVDR